MKYIFTILTFLFFLSTMSCHAQKLVEKPGEAKKLELHKQQFIGKALKDLLTQIGPEIKFAYGNPENKSSATVGGTFIRFYFIDQVGYRKKINKNERPTSIVVVFQLERNNTKKAFPKEGVANWTTANTQEYGDMIIFDIRVSGTDRF